MKGALVAWKLLEGVVKQCPKVVGDGRKETEKEKMVI